jgi:hypothetical protein
VTTHVVVEMVVCGSALGIFFVDYYLCGFEWVKSTSVILCLGFHEWTSYFDLDYGIIVMLLGV